MKRNIVFMLLLIFSIAFVSCDDSNNNDITYYGVAGYIDMGEDYESPLSINIPKIGWVVLPSMEINAFIDGEHYENYEVLKGDLIKIYFDNIENLEILESFPAQFGKNPTSIEVFNSNDIILEKQEDNSWLFNIPRDDIVIENTFFIEDISIGETLYFDKYQIVNKDITESYLCEVILEERTDSRLSFIISNDYIDEVLAFHYTNNIVVCPTNYFD